MELEKPVRAAIGLFRRDAPSSSRRRTTAQDPARRVSDRFKHVPVVRDNPWPSDVRLTLLKLSHGAHALALPSHLSILALGGIRPSMKSPGLPGFQRPDLEQSDTPVYADHRLVESTKFGLPGQNPSFVAEAANMVLLFCACMPAGM